MSRGEGKMVEIFLEKFRIVLAKKRAQNASNDTSDACLEVSRQPVVDMVSPWVQKMSRGEKNVVVIFW